MKKILSVFLAVLMTIGMVSVFAISSAAIDGVTAPQGLTVKLGTTTVEPGTEVAYLDLCISATALPASYERLRDWQFVFSGAQVAKSHKYYTVPADSDVYAFTNLTNNQVGATLAANTYFADAASLTTGDGVKVAEIAFTVPASAKKGDEIEVTVADVDALSFENSSLTPFAAKGADITLVAGKIIIGSAVMYGDVNDDGSVNKKDSLALKKYLADNTAPINSDAADVVKDGTVNKKDSLRLKQYLAGWDVVLGA